MSNISFGILLLVAFFSTFLDLLRYNETKGGERNNWDLVRYKHRTRTVEFRMFGTTPDIEEIVGYVKACLELFREIKGLAC